MLEHQDMTVEQFGRCLVVETAVLYRYALQLTRHHHRAEDLVQDCLARALVKRELYKPGGTMRAWLCTMLRNLFVSSTRSKASRQHVALDPTDMPAAPPAQLDHLRLRELERALGLLRPEQRAVVMLIAVEGLDYRAAAERLGVPIGTVRSRLARGRSALADMVGADRVGADRGRDDRYGAGATMRRGSPTVGPWEQASAT
jgi:RNA polymerase sigma-70 factor, ECF subfamily